MRGEADMDAPLGTPPFGPFPVLRPALRAANGVTDYFQDGAPSFMSSANAVVNGTALQLAAPAGGVSWAVYELPALVAGDALAFLYVDSTNHVFSGRTPGMWFCLANYETGKWELLSRTESFGYKRVMSKMSPYLSPSQNVYVGLIVADTQETTIVRVGVGVSRDWASLTLADGSDTGIDPSVAIDMYGSVHVAFAEGGAGNPQYAMCLGTDNQLDKANWDFSLIETSSPGVARSTDLVIDDESGQPRPVATYVYKGLDDAEGNSEVVLAALVDHPTQGLLWANYPFHADGAYFTSLDQSRVDGAMGFVCGVDNANSAPANPNDIEYRHWDLNVAWDPADNGPVDKYTGYGEGIVYPHLRFHPEDGNGAIVADGGLTLWENGPGDWPTIYERPESENFGSLAFVPAGVTSDTVFGATYSEVQGASENLIYVDYDASQLGVPEMVDSLPAALGSFMAGTSQLAYTREGDAVIAYTVRQAGKVSVRFAKKSGGSWTVQTVVPDAGNSTDRLGVVVDLAVEPVTLFFHPTERAAIVYNRSVAGVNSLEIAVKDELPAT
jgi:hypothetical protein